MKRLSTFRKGTHAYLHGRRCTIIGTAGAKSVRVVFLDGGETVQTDIENLWEDISPDAGAADISIDILHPEDLEIARGRLAAIEPIVALLDKPAKEEAFKTLYKAVSEGTGHSVRTLYRWVSDYTARNMLTDLAPRRRRRHKRRLDNRSEEIIQDALKRYLSERRPSIKAVHKYVAQQCRDIGADAPHINTLRRRIKELPPKEIVSARFGPKAARDLYEQIRGHYPGADYPLAYVQIDHTLLDIQAVSAGDRLAIGKVWLTLAIDVYSRMIVGFYITIEAPSAFSTCMCIRNAVLPKESFLLGLDVKGEWPVWGFMRHLHADNGPDFRSEVYKANLQQYGCWPLWRKLRKPHYGAHIERLIGTINRDFHDLPGTTFSNPRERATYDSEGNAVFTIDELEQVVAHWVVNIYHKSFHEGIGCTPLEKWEAGILGTDGSPGVGLQDRVEDPERVALDLLPFTERTVQRDGISWESITYISEALIPWIKADEGRSRKKFKVRRDPRDITCIWFLDPKSGAYHRIPEETRQMKPISIWDHRLARRIAAARGSRTASTLDTLDAHRDLERMVQAAEEQTMTAKGARKSTRRRAERQRRNQKTLEGEAYTGKTSESPASSAGKVSTRPRLIVDNEKPNKKPARQINEDNDLDLSIDDLTPRAEEL